MYYVSKNLKFQTDFHMSNEQK